MSHYSEVTTTFRDDKALISALIDMGFAKSEVHVSKVPVKLAGTTSQAHIMVQRAAIKRLMGYSYTDLGFEKMADGLFKAHIDNYTFDQPWKNKLHQRYDYRLRMEQLRISGHQLTETTTSDGTIIVRARR